MAVQAALNAAQALAPIGVDLTKTTSTPKFTLGAVAKLDNNGEAVYCLSSGTLAQYGLVAIDEDFTARGATTTNAKLASGPGWPQVAFAQDTYGWIQTKGSNMLGKQKDATAADAQLFTSTSVGIMGSDGSTGAPVMIAGARAVSLSSGAGAAYEIYAVNPHFIVAETM